MIVQLEGRTFIVTMEAGQVARIKERKIHEPGRPWEAVYDQLRWARSLHPVPTKQCLTARILDAVRT